MKKKTVVLVIVAVLLLPEIAYSCFSPADNYAVEVVLNKPGVNYDLGPLGKMNNILRRDEYTYLYRSHYDSRLIVTVSLQSLSRLNVEELPPKPAVLKAVKASVDVETLDSAVEASAKNYGWLIAYKTPMFKAGYAAVLEKQAGLYHVWLYILAGEPGEIQVGLTVSGKKKPTIKQAEAIEGDVKGVLTTTGLSPATTVIDADFVLNAFRRMEPREKIGAYLAVRVQIPLKVVKTQTTSLSCSFEMENVEPPAISKDAFKKTGWSLPQYDPQTGFAAEKRDGKTIYMVTAKKSDKGMFFYLSAENAESVDQARKVYRELFLALGIGTETVDKCAFITEKTVPETRIKPAYNISDEQLSKALAAELKWLLEAGVIRGLSETDVAAIASNTKKGYAGWNSRLVWDGEKWIPYYEAPGALLIKCVGPVPSNYLSLNLTAPPKPGETPAGGQPTPGGNTGSTQQGNITVFLAIMAVISVALAVAIYLFIRSGK